VVHYAPDGSEIERLRLPTPLVSCPAFGGDGFNDLYVTTAGGDDRAKNGPLAGALFRLRPGVNGVQEFRSRVLDDVGL
jgi:D-xylonolactonase